MKYCRVILIVVGVSTVACSNRGVYDTIQTNNRLDCQTQPLSQQEECRRQAGKSYEEYERERQELLKQED